MLLKHQSSFGTVQFLINNDDIDNSNGIIILAYSLQAASYYIQVVFTNLDLYYTSIST